MSGSHIVNCAQCETPCAVSRAERKHALCAACQRKQSLAKKDALTDSVAQISEAITECLNNKGLRQ